MKIIDIHTHIYPEKIAIKAISSLSDFYHLPMEGEGTAENLKSNMTEEMRAVLLPVAVRPQNVDSINEFVYSKVSSDDKFIGFGTLHPHMENVGEEIEKIEKMGLKGVKFHADMQKIAIDDPVMFPVYDALAGRLPVIFHCGDFRSELSRPKKVAKVVREFPKLTVIAAHFGGWSLFDEAYDELKNLDCFIDTSSSIMFMPREKTAKLLNAYGSHRLIFGSDYPMCSPKEEAERLLSFGMGEKFYERVMYKNAAELLGIE